LQVISQPEPPRNSPRRRTLAGGDQVSIDIESEAENALAYFEADLNRFGEVTAAPISDWDEGEISGILRQALARAETDLALGLIGADEIGYGWLFFRDPDRDPGQAVRWDVLAAAAGIDLIAELALLRTFPKRKPVSRAVTRAVWDRDGWECVHCGSHRDLTVDHVIPVVLGGTDDMDNLRTLCRPCNSSKGARAIVGANRPRLVIA
jgi:HNH endonuclease